MTESVVYFDHPVAAMAQHTLNIDFLASAGGPAERVAVQSTAASARALVTAINAALASTPAGLTV